MLDMSKWRSPGDPIPDVDDPMKEGAGAASWAKDRADRPDLTLAGEPKIQPMSLLPEFHVDDNDPDPRGMDVVSGDGKVVGQINDIWVDRSEPQIRYLQVGLEGGENILAPMGFCRLGSGKIHIKALYAHLFADVPKPKATDRITLLEEDRIFGWFAGGYRYSAPDLNETII